MKGFKNTTKTISGHHFASGGIVPEIGRGGMPGMKMNSPSVRPVMPRPHVMPGGKPFGMKTAKLAKGGRFGEGNSLDHPVPYSDVESEHPRNSARPGYAKGGIHIKPSHKGLFTKKMTGSKSGHLTDKNVSEGLHSSSGVTRKQANFARMARRGFKPLKKAKGGAVDCDEGSMRRVADQEVAKHVASKPPQGHGVKPRGGLGAFNRTPLCGGGKV